MLKQFCCVVPMFASPGSILVDLCFGLRATAKDCLMDPK